MHPICATSYESLKMNVSKVKHDISLNLPRMWDRAMYAQPYPVEHLCSLVSKGPKLCHGNAVNEGHLKLSIIYKGKLTESVTPMNVRIWMLTMRWNGKFHQLLTHGSKWGCVCTASYSRKSQNRMLSWERGQQSIPWPERRYRTMLNITRETYNVWNCHINVRHLSQSCITRVTTRWVAVLRKNRGVIWCWSRDFEELIQSDLLVLQANVHGHWTKRVMSRVRCHGLLISSMLH